MVGELAVVLFEQLDCAPKDLVKVTATQAAISFRSYARHTTVGMETKAPTTHLVIASY